MFYWIERVVGSNVIVGSAALTIGGPGEMTSEGDVVACRCKERGLPRPVQLEGGMWAASPGGGGVGEVNGRACARKGRWKTPLRERLQIRYNARDAMSASGHSLCNVDGRVLLSGTCCSFVADCRPEARWSGGGTSGEGLYA